MKKDYKRFWELIKECLNYEQKSLKRNLKSAKKNDSFHEASSFREELGTIEWLLEEIENIEDKGELL